MDDRLICRIKTDKKVFSQNKGQAQQATKEHPCKQVDLKDFFAPVKPHCPIVLTGEGDRSLTKCANKKIGEILKIQRGRRAGHCIGAEAVDFRLNKDIRQRKNHTLDPCRNSYLQNALQNFLFDRELAEINPYRLFFMRQYAKDDTRAYYIGNNGGNRHPRNAHVEHNDQQQIQAGVDDARNDQAI